tara:strand:+ start:3455 stop:4291 length:837 start_codon:yes stop_codon:yes gene_type:complete
LFLSEIKKKLLDNFLLNGIETPELDARLVLKEVLSFDDKDLILRENENIPEKLIKKIFAIEARRLKGEPISKIFKKRDFYQSTFLISNDVLDPRPETELIVDIANNFIKKNKVKNILDLGTGSGCILLSLLKENKMINGLGIDISKEAINIAQKNSKKLQLDKQSNFLISNWMSSIKFKYDIVVSNPPYIPRKDIKKLSNSVRNYDPILSLDGGNDGLDCYRVIAKDLKRIINKDAIIIIEIGYNQFLSVIEIFKNNDFKLIKKYNDINGLDRVLTFQ